MEYKFSPIGYVHSPFKEKVGVPKQSLMAMAAKAVLKLKPDPDYRTALNHLSEFSHLWIVFVFDRNLSEQWTPTIVPPRVDAPNRVGVFASRSPHRPNPIGLSVVKLERLDLDALGGIELHLSGVDLLDQTPVLDIKPYLPLVDSVPDAFGGWANASEPKYEVEFSVEAHLAIEGLKDSFPNLQNLIHQVLENDPRPIAQRKAMPIEDPIHDGKTFGFRLEGLEIKWSIQNGKILVLNVKGSIL